MAKIAIATEPTVEPVSLTEILTHLRIDQDDERDADLMRLAKVARLHIERQKIRRAIINQTWDQYFDAFANPLRVRWGTVSSITSIKYTDTDGDEQTTSTDVYELGHRHGQGIARLKYNQNWPTAVRSHPDAVVVRYVAGYGAAASNVPEPIRQAILIMVADMWENPESLVTGTIATQLPHEGTVNNLLAQYTVRMVV